MSEIWPYIAGIVPTIVVATMFYFLIKSMLEGDRRERLAQSRFEAEQDREDREDRRAGNSPTDSVGPESPSQPASGDRPPAPDGTPPEFLTDFNCPECCPQGFSTSRNSLVNCSRHRSRGCRG